MPKHRSTSRPISRSSGCTQRSDADLSTTATADTTWDFNRRWTHSNDWLLSLLRLVESEVGFSALKFSNYLEAELRLFRGLPELRSLCREARRLCRSNPRVSPYVADRVGQLQSAWLAIESRLAEFKSQKSLLTALSGDLKLLEMGQDARKNSSANDYSVDKNMCCTKKMELLDGAIQKKDDQMQQMLSVTAAVSKLLDLICTSDLLCIREHHNAARRHGVPNSPMMRQGVVAPSNRDQQSASSTGSTTYVRTVTNTDGDQADPMTSESSEIITQTGHNSDRRELSRSHESVRLEPVAREVQTNQATENVALAPTTNRTELVVVPDCETVVAESQPSIAEYTEDAIDYCSPSPLLQTVGDRVAALKSSTERIHASLAAESADSADNRLSRLTMAEAALGGCQSELASLRASVVAAAATEGPDNRGPEEAIFRRAYLESIALLTNWTGSLRDRCKSKLLELRRQSQDQLDRSE